MLENKLFLIVFFIVFNIKLPLFKDKLVSETILNEKKTFDNLRKLKKIKCITKIFLEIHYSL